MKYKPVILILFLLFLSSSNLFAQEFYTSLNNYNNILINPSYAGFNYESNVWNSWSVFVKGPNNIFDEFNLVYDRYAPKLKGGTALYIKQGLQAATNLNTLELGFSFTPRISRFNGTFLPSVYVGYEKPVKHWFVYGFDDWRNSEEFYQNIPGKAFLRSDVYKLGGSMLFVIDNLRFGLSGIYGWQLKPDNKVISSEYPYKLIVHLSTRVHRKSHGILYRSKQISPQFILHYENGLFETKSELRIIGRKYLYSAFLLDDISDNIHSLGGSAGFDNDSMRLILSLGLGSTPNFDRLSFYSSISFVIKLPKENIKRYFPFKPLD